MTESERYASNIYENVIPLPRSEEEIWVREQRLARRRARLRLERARRRRRARIRRNRLVVLLLLTAIVAGLWNIVGALTATGGKANARAATALSWPAQVGPSSRVSGHLTAFSWPSNGEAAVGLQGSGVIAASPRQRVVPIASMTKMMTAILILKDHPLRPGQMGPSLRMSAGDATAWVIDSQNGDSVVPVQAGERLSEFQMLQGLLISSGDNIADILAVWDDHSIARFVAKMNVEARRLGLLRTVYADASGVNPQSRSTPAEQIKVASLLMKNPVARTIVAEKSIPFPVAGTIANYNPALGTDGIIGVKSGFTHAAMGCLAVAAMRTVNGHRVMMIAVSTGNTFGLYGAARVDEQLLTQALPDLVVVRPLRKVPVLTSIDVPGSTTKLTLRPMRKAPVYVAWRGARITSSVLVNPTAVPNGAGLAARLVFKTPTGTLGSVALTSAPSGSVVNGAAS